MSNSKYLGIFTKEELKFILGEKIYSDQPIRNKRRLLKSIEAKHREFQRYIGHMTLLWSSDPFGYLEEEKEIIKIILDGTPKSAFDKDLRAFYTTILKLCKKALKKSKNRGRRSGYTDPDYDRARNKWKRLTRNGSIGYIKKIRSILCLLGAEKRLIGEISGDLRKYITNNLAETMNYGDKKWKIGKEVLRRFQMRIDRREATRILKSLMKAGIVECSGTGMKSKWKLTDTGLSIKNMTV